MARRVFRSIVVKVAQVAAPAPAPAAPAAAADPVAGKSGAELVQQWGCNACHKFDGPDRLVGPSL